MPGLRFIALGCIASVLSLHACADDEELPLRAFPSVQWHGFITVGAAQSDQTHLIELRDLMDSEGVKRGGNPLLTDSRLGLQTDMLFDPQWSATMQWVLKDRPVQNLSNTVQWAFVKYQPVPAMQWRIGRMGADSFMLSDQRNVGFTYLWVRPPIEFYGMLSAYSYDGADLRYRLPLGHGFLEAKTFYGRTIPDFAATNFLSPEKSFEINIKPLYGANVSWHDENNWQARLSYADGVIDSTYPGLDTLLNLLHSITGAYPPAADIAQTLTMKGSTVQFLSLGGMLNSRSWKVQSELYRMHFSSGFKPDTYAGYLSVGRDFGAWTPYMEVARVWPARRPPFVNADMAPPGLPQLLVTVVNQQIYTAAQENQSTWTTGVRWDFYNSMDLKLQYDHTHVFGTSYALWKTDGVSATSQGPNVNALSLSLDAVF